ncbi:GNAT family N-acetyltransferase [Roseibium sp.]|uniref:GNAT family N-acetyltransferase n=1 Tax=Roseibium sp. TaxID=1936156 RepID=UPI003B516B40
MQIRRAAISDEPSIRVCAEDSYAPYIAAIGKKPAPMTADFAAQIHAGYIDIATDDTGQLQGFIVFFAKDDHMFLENVAIHAAAAGQGIGKALISHCETQARALGLLSVRLYTNEKMTANLKIYPKLGYTESGRRKEDGFNRVYFEKLLG